MHPGLVTGAQAGAALTGIPTTPPTSLQAVAAVSIARDFGDLQASADVYSHLLQHRVVVAPEHDTSRAPWDPSPDSAGG